MNLNRQASSSSSSSTKRYDSDDDIKNYSDNDSNDSQSISIKSNKSKKSRRINVASSQPLQRVYQNILGTDRINEISNTLNQLHVNIKHRHQRDGTFPKSYRSRDSDNDTTMGSDEDNDQNYSFTNKRSRVTDVNPFLLNEHDRNSSNNSNQDYINTNYGGDYEEYQINVVRKLLDIKIQQNKIDHIMSIKVNSGLFLIDSGVTNNVVSSISEFLGLPGKITNLKLMYRVSKEMLLE